ncbi:MAG: hypothetical protein ACYSSN_01585 [Planctomycetota bacterium]|jgi:hypothetical protein
MDTKTCNCSAAECAKKRKKAFNTAIVNNALEHTGIRNEEPLGLPAFNFAAEDKPVKTNAGDALGLPNWDF